MGDSLNHPADLNGVLLGNYVIDPPKTECFQCRPLLRDRPDLAANLFDAYLAHCDDSLSSLSVSVDSSVLASEGEAVSSSSLDFSLSSSVSASATFSGDS